MLQGYNNIQNKVMDIVTDNDSNMIKAFPLPGLSDEHISDEVRT